MKKYFFIFLGPPASGKGTQADILGEKMGLPVISTGELLRHEIDIKSSIGKEVKKMLSKGDLVSDITIKKIIDKRLKRKDVQKGFIFDGYPRRDSQLDLLKKRLEKISSKNDVILAVYINVGDDVVKKRISGRRVCDCGAVYHIKFNPPKKPGICDICKDKLYSRSDDTISVLNKRLKNFHLRIDPIRDFFKKNKMLIDINGENDIKKVTNEIWRKIKKY